jgi:hypothetical protein
MGTICQIPEFKVAAFASMCAQRSSKPRVSWACCPRPRQPATEQSQTARLLTLSAFACSLAVVNDALSASTCCTNSTGARCSPIALCLATSKPDERAPPLLRAVHACMYRLIAVDRPASRLGLTSTVPCRHSCPAFEACRSHLQ